MTPCDIQRLSDAQGAHEHSAMFQLRNIDGSLENTKSVSATTPPPYHQHENQTDAHQRPATGDFDHLQRLNVFCSKIIQDNSRRRSLQREHSDKDLHAADSDVGHEK